MAGRLGELLVRENLITISQLQQAQETQRKEGGRLGYNLTKLGFIQEQDLTNFLAKQYGVPAINLADFEIEADVIKLIPKDVAEKHQVIPVNRAGSSLIVAMSDPSNIFAIDDIKFLTGYNIEVVVAAEGAIKTAIERYYNPQGGGATSTGGGEIPAGGGSMEEIMQEMASQEEDVEVAAQEETGNVVDLQAGSGDAPVVKLVNLILVEAIKKKASDIHVEPYEKDFRVRYRIDGMLYEVMKPPIKLKTTIVARIKVMANLDIAERRLPQDGRIKLKIGTKEMDYRVSILPCLFGEKVVLRLLDKSNLQLDMTKLGLEQHQINDLLAGIKKPYGMCLVTGPTGSGKTTTLYSALSSLNQSNVNIATAEDPVEFNFAGINQVQMQDGIGLNFAAALRSFLRQDPNIIMVGEIRDFETAEIAVKASLTGHMVLSTLHTNDAPSTVTRMLNMGIEPFLVCASVNVILAQRLARRVCKECGKPIEVPRDALLGAGLKPDELVGFQAMKGGGCKTCSETGYKGRVALYEILTMKDELKECVLNGASTAEIKTEAIRVGMQTLRASALKKFKEGITTVEEVLRVSAAD